MNRYLSYALRRPVPARENGLLSDIWAAIRQYKAYGSSPFELGLIHR